MPKSASLAAIIAFLEDADSCTIKVDEHEVKFLDESGISSRPDSFFVAGHEFGATHLIHARSFESAWEAWVDESPTIPESELPEAYGIDDSPEMAAWKETHECPPYSPRDAWDAWHDAKAAEARRILDQWHDDARAGVRHDWPDLVEGYEYQSNASGTGIVDVGHYAWMHDADQEEVTVTPKEET